jgi:DNA-binding NtrC family response regulator
VLLNLFTNACAAMRLLEAYDWPGNVRELQNIMERAVVLAEYALVRPQDLLDQIRVNAEAASPLSPNELPLKWAKEVWAGSFERDDLIQLLSGMTAISRRPRRPPVWTSKNDSSPDEEVRDQALVAVWGVRSLAPDG